MLKNTQSCKTAQTAVLFCYLLLILLLHHMAAQQYTINKNTIKYNTV